MESKMPNFSRIMLLFLYLTALLATGNCHVAAMLGQPLKLAMSLFGGGRNDQTPLPTHVAAPLSMSAPAPIAAPIQTAPVAAPNAIIPPPAPILGANRDGDSELTPIVRPMQNYVLEPWKDSTPSQQSGPGGLNPNEHQAWRGPRPAESWSSQHKGPSKGRYQLTEPWRHDSLNDGHGDGDIVPHVKPLQGDSWTGGHHSVDTYHQVSWAGRPKYTETEKIKPHVKPLNDDSDEKLAAPWNINRPKPVHREIPRPDVTPLLADDDTQEKINKLWETDKWASRQKLTSPKKDRHQIIAEPWNSGDPSKIELGIDHESWSGLGIVPGRESDNYYGGWNKKLRSQLSVKRSGNIIPILTYAPWHEDDADDESGKNRKLGGRAIELVRRQQGESDEQYSRHIIHGRMGDEAPIDSLEDIPGIRSNYMILTAKPLVAHGTQTYRHSAAYNGFRNRPKKIVPSTLWF